VHPAVNGGDERLTANIQARLGGSMQPGALLASGAF
jgi:hypothetical protein